MLEKSHTLNSLYSSTQNMNWFPYLKKMISENKRNMGLLVGYYYKPLWTLGLMGSRYTVNSVADIYKSLATDNIDITYFHNLNIKHFFGQDLEKLIFQCLKYDYQFDKTPIILNSIIENPINSEFTIFNKGYEILCFFPSLAISSKGTSFA